MVIEKRDAAVFKYPDALTDGGRVWWCPMCVGEVFTYNTSAHTRLCR